MDLLVSKVSAGGRATALGHEVAQILRTNGWEIRVHYTDASDHLPHRVAELSETLLGAVGGDGYLASIAASVAATPGKILVPFPGGRGNDLCRALNLGTSATRRAHQLSPTWQGRVRTIDGMWVDSATNPAPVLAVGIVSLGIDASANQIANKLQWGPVSYAWGAIHAFLRHRFHDVKGTIDGKVTDFSGWVSSVSNSGWMGGGINLVPASDLEDGVLEIFTVPPASRWRVLPLLVRALTVAVPRSPLIRVRAGKEVVITADSPVAAMADGDHVGDTPLRIRVAPQALRVLV